MVGLGIFFPFTPAADTFKKALKKVFEVCRLAVGLALAEKGRGAEVCMSSTDKESSCFASFQEDEERGT